MASGPVSGVGVFTLDRELVVRSWDPWLADATGLAAVEACGRSLTALYPDVAERGFVPRLARVAETGVVEVLAPAFHHYLIPCEPREPSAHFARMQQHVTMSPLRPGNGDGPDGVIVTIEDVTARMDRERTLADELRSHDDAIRLRAARALADEGHSTVLETALADESWRIRRAAAKGMAHAGDNAIALLVETIRERHRDISVLNAAIEALAGTKADAVPAILELLDAAEADVRTYAALTLGLLRDSRAVPKLLRALRDADQNVRYHAIEALGRIGAREAAGAIMQVAESRDFTLAFVALDALRAIGDPLVAPRLLPLVEDPLLAGAAVECLGQLGGEETVVPLCAALGTPDAPAASIAMALASLHRRLEESGGLGALVADLARGAIDPEGARRLAEAVPHATDDELETLALVLGWLPYDGLDDVLATLLTHARTRDVAAEALARHGDTGIDALLSVASHGEGDTRRAAINALGRSGSRRAVSTLVGLLGRDPEDTVVAAAALGAIGDRRAFEPLLGLLDEPLPSVRQAAVAALSSLAHPDMHAHVRVLLNDPSPRRREAAARMAGYFGLPHTLEHLLALCDDPDPLVRRAALEHVVFFEDPRAIDKVRAALAGGDAALRVSGARALAQLDAPDLAALIRGALHDGDMWVRYFAARAAARQRQAGRDIVGDLERLAGGDPAPPVRVAAIESLGAIGDAAATPLLVRLVGDADPPVAQAAIGALGEIGGDDGVQVLLRLATGDDRMRAIAALRALQPHAPAIDVNELAQLARSDDRDISELAVGLLGHAGRDDAVNALLRLPLAASRRPSVVRALADAPSVTSDAFAHALGHHDAAVRQLAVEALSRARHPRASQLLAGALDDESPYVRLEASRALSRLDRGYVRR